MAIFSKLRPSDASIANFASTYATHRPLIQRSLTSGFVVYVLASTYRSLSARPSKPSSDDGGTGGKKGKGKKGGDGKAPRVAVSHDANAIISVVSHFISTDKVDAIFYQRLAVILRIVIPGWRSKEALLLVMHSSLLIFRTAISLYVAALDGK